MMHIGKAEIDKMMDGRGRRYPATAYAHYTIPKLFKIAARTFYPDLSKCGQAEQLAAHTLRYQTGKFRRATEPTCEDRHRGTVFEIIHLILRLRDRAPSARTIRRWL